MMQTVDASMLVMCVKNIQEMTTRRRLQWHQGRETAQRERQTWNNMHKACMNQGLQSVIGQANLAKFSNFIFPKETL